MAAESLDYRPATVGLLYEPDQPVSVHSNGVTGWRRTGAAWQREHRDDRLGARVQFAIARYFLTDYTRADMARDLCTSERQCQAYISGKATLSYVRPVLDALRRLGITRSRGNWAAAQGSRRSREIVLAQADVLARCRALLGGVDFNPAALDELQADLILLSLVVDDRP